MPRTRVSPNRPLLGRGEVVGDDSEGRFGVRVSRLLPRAAEGGCSRTRPLPWSFVNSFLYGVAAVAGVVLVVAVWRAAILALVVARPTRSVLLYRAWIALVSAPVNAVAKRVSYARRDALLAPVGSLMLISLVPFWLALFGFGYALILLGLGHLPMSEALRQAGSSLFTLGFSAPQGGVSTMVSFLAAITGPLLIALLIGYLPTLYAAFNRRETEVSLLAGRGGDPAWGPVILLRYQIAGVTEQLGELFASWERLAADIAESHTSYPTLAFFRSPDLRRSWLTSLMAVLDAAAIQLARTPSAASASARLVITGGTSALKSINAALRLPLITDPLPNDRISLTYQDFHEAWLLLDRAGYPAQTDPETAWKDFKGWRVNWEHNAFVLAKKIHSPPLDWTGPRNGNIPRLVRDLPRNRRHDDLDGLNFSLRIWPRNTPDPDPDDRPAP